jgi:hypothetical protein
MALDAVHNYGKKKKRSQTIQLIKRVLQSVTNPIQLIVKENPTSIISKKHFDQSTGLLFPDKPSPIITSTCNILTYKSIKKHCHIRELLLHYIAGGLKLIH